MLRARAAETGAWIVYVNAVGGQDELVFDGGSLVVAPDGRSPVVPRGSRRTCSSPPSRDGELRAERPRPRGPTEPPRTSTGALQLGTGDYVRKNGFAERGARPIGRDRLRARRRDRRRCARAGRGARDRACRACTPVRAAWTMLPRSRAASASGSTRSRSPTSTAPTQSRSSRRRTWSRASPRRTCRRASAAPT